VPDVHVVRATGAGIDPAGELQQRVAAQRRASGVYKGQIAQRDATDASARQDEQGLLYWVKWQRGVRRDKRLCLAWHGSPERKTARPALQDSVKQGVRPRPVHGAIRGAGRCIAW